MSVFSPIATITNKRTEQGRVEQGVLRMADLTLNYWQGQMPEEPGSWCIGGGEVSGQQKGHRKRGKAKDRYPDGSAQRNRVSQLPPLNVLKGNPGVFIGNTLLLCTHYLLAKPSSKTF